MQQINSTCVIASSAADGFWKNGAKCARSTLPLLVAASWLGIAMSIATAGDEKFARVCAERDIEVVTLIESHGRVTATGPFIGNETLHRAALMLLDARKECYRDRVAEALSAYDKIVSMLGPVSAQRTR